MILGRSDDIWTTNDVGMLKGLVQSGAAARAAGRSICAATRSTSSRPSSPPRTTARCSPRPSSGAPVARRPADSPVAVDEPDRDGQVTATEDECRDEDAQPATARRLCRAAPAGRSDQAAGAGPSRGAPDDMRDVPRRHRPRARKILYEEVARRKGNVRGTTRTTGSSSAPGRWPGLPVWGTGGLTVVTRGAMTNGADVHPGQRLLRRQPQVLRLRRHRHPGPGEGAGSTSTSTTTGSSCATRGTSSARTPGRRRTR